MNTRIMPTEKQKDLAVLMPAYNTEQRAQLIAESELTEVQRLKHFSSGT